MRRIRGSLLFLLLFGAACFTVHGADPKTPLSLAVNLEPGALFAYDGTYRLSVPSSKNTPGLTLVSVVYGLVFKVEAVDAEGAILRADYDRFESQMRQGNGISPLAGFVYGRGFRFRLNSRGQPAALPEGGAAPGLETLREIWPGWPAEELKVGSSWRTENQMPVAGGTAKAVREYRYEESGEEKGRITMILSFVERGTIDGQVGLSGGTGRLKGTILGVGQVRVDRVSGLVERASSVSVFEGTLTPGGAAPTAVRLEIETTVFQRAAPVQNPG